MSASINDTAIRWAVRIDAAPLDEAQKQELTQWLEQDRRHRGALFRAQAGLVLVESTPDAPLQSHSDDRRMRRRWTIATGAVAACFALVFALAWPALFAQRIDTELGEIRRVTLSDGSVAMVNSQSRLAVDYEQDVRHLRLDEGEAWFKVSTDIDRPFTVDAGGVQVRATGTAFSVRRRSREVDVVVTEGSVLVWRTGQAKQAVAVDAGKSATIPISATSRPVTYATGDRDILAWRQGGLELSDMTVLEAAEEFNRHNVSKIEIASPRIGAQTMTGYFQLDRPDEFSQAVADITGAKISKKPNKIVIE